MREPILIPAPTLERLEALIIQRQRLEERIDGTLETLRETLGVPNDYQIGEVRQGFVPPAKQEQTVQ
jgi:hypothetical protein